LTSNVTRNVTVQPSKPISMTQSLSCLVSVICKLSSSTTQDTADARSRAAGYLLVRGVACCFLGCLLRFLRVLQCVLRGLFRLGGGGVGAVGGGPRILAACSAAVAASRAACSAEAPSSLA
jgi:hypothetical protein